MLPEKNQGGRFRGRVRHSEVPLPKGEPRVQYPPDNLEEKNSFLLFTFGQTFKHNLLLFRVHLLN